MPLPRDRAPSEPLPTEDLVVAALRRVMRAVDLHSRQLQAAHGLTGPQLAALRAIERLPEPTPATVANDVHLSRGTLSGILARLEERGLVARAPSERDRRSVVLSPTDLGQRVLLRAPSLLQDRFRERLGQLADWEQLQLLTTLTRIASMMDAEALDAAPHLVARSEELNAELQGDGWPGADAPTNGTK